MNKWYLIAINILKIQSSTWFNINEQVVTDSYQYIENTIKYLL
jgi:hypothetical protein